MAVSKDPVTGKWVVTGTTGAFRGASSGRNHNVMGVPTYGVGPGSMPVVPRFGLRGRQRAGTRRRHRQRQSRKTRRHH